MMCFRLIPMVWTCLRDGVSLTFEFSIWIRFIRLIGSLVRDTLGSGFDPRHYPVADHFEKSSCPAGEHVAFGRVVTDTH